MSRKSKERQNVRKRNLAIGAYKLSQEGFSFNEIHEQTGIAKDKIKTMIVLGERLFDIKEPQQ